MAAINDLLRQITDPTLRERLTEEVNRISKNKKFGLVFEEHVPECTPLYGVPVRRGSTVARKTGKMSEIYTVKKIDGEVAVCEDKITLEVELIPLSEIVSVAQFGEPIFPTLEPIDKIANAQDDNLWHTIIEADNYHALQLLEYLYEGKVDCIYIDPPYNTGARDWKYNNDYVDSSDAWRHSKWLSMMKKRLIIAKRVLNPDSSVLICTIDEKEYLHLGCLLEELFPEARIQMVTSVISSQGSTRDGLFSRADEYLFFVFLGDAEVVKSEDDMLNEGQSATKGQLWFQFVRTGKGNLRENSKNLFYPIFIDSSKGKIESIGEPIPLGVPKESITVPEGQLAIWPMTADGREARWRTGVEVARRRVSKGLLRLGKTSRKENGWSVLTVNEGTEKRIEIGEVVIESIDESGAAKLVEKYGGSLRAPKTVWNKTSHNAGWHGSKLLAKILVDRKFPYPKSLYAVQDALSVVSKNKNALILDFFAGSGTTLHAVNLLNSIDGGSRRCILVTNNEVSEDEAKALTKQHLHPGDVEWEKYGIARYVTWPRTICSIKGVDINGNPIQGNYLTNNAPMSEGFAANVEYFKLGFLDKNSVSLGQQFCEILPLLWLKAGAVGERPELNGLELPDMLVLPQNSFAVLLDEDCYGKFAEALNEDKNINTVYFVTNSEEAFREMSDGIGIEHTYQLYRDYIDNFVIGSRRNNL
ncbi:site-specific DNA-methyltransferase [Pelotomaculum isophthalicicum JI]|uniref:Site-specific DNA-methyltransferase n=1 Tax=Pelotomaculum isophthalicicum JI TaxID=947010 RepID=A0A9X4GY25_9FIRM|nr:DNA methyltransferase [Pelotomaculum isophthalicicum]MDF9407357.1 site-specific DNA-methyltransferase [Pelotomaculum isophthalicicum JI]